MVDVIAEVGQFPHALVGITRDRRASGIAWIDQEEMRGEPVMDHDLEGIDQSIPGDVGRHGVTGWSPVVDQFVQQSLRS
jgi:hypothetical protein